MNLHDAATNESGTLLTPQDAAVVEGMAALRISQWWERADLTESFPADDATVVQLVNAVDYVLTLEDLVRFIDVQAFAAVAVAYGRRCWSARDVVRLATFLECRRDWRPDSEIHATKWTVFEKALHEFRATGQSHMMFEDLTQFDLKALLLLMTESPNRNQREAIYVSLLLKLETFDINP